MDPYLGEIRAVGFAFPPLGWAECNGALLSIRQYTALFSLLGVQYGGDGLTTFGLPDLRGRVSVGQGQGIALSPYINGEQGGSETETITTASMAAHNHTFAATNVLGTTTDPSMGTFARPDVIPREQLLYLAAGGSAPSPTLLAPAGGNQSHENRQALLTVLYVIALQGVFPARG